MPHIVTSYAAPLAPPTFSKLSHKRHDFWKTLLNKKVCSDFLYKFLPKTFLILRRIQRDIVINVKSLYVKYPLFLSEFTETRIFSTDFRKKPKYQVSSQFDKWEPSGGRWTDTTRFSRTHLKIAFIPSYLAQCFKICWWRKYFFIQNDFLPPFGLCVSGRLHHSPPFPPLMPMVLLTFLARVVQKSRLL